MTTAYNSMQRRHSITVQTFKQHVTDDIRPHLMK